ncbi:MAG TPA: recombinase family protein [Nitrospiraceae bacterium]|nr:recombinase family protein [Nitrospiraceae bacterium]
MTSGAEQIETAYALKQIIDAGVRVCFNLENRERTLDTAMDTMMLSLTNFGAEMEREKARQRTHDAMLRKARAGHAVDGKVLGYDHVDVPGAPGPDGKPYRQYVVRLINSTEAIVVRRIFEGYGSGLGLTRLAKNLNNDHIPPPRGDVRGWAPTSIREIIHRELYVGVVLWNRTQSVQ